MRETTRGSLKLRVLRKSVYVYDEHSGKGRRYELLVTESLDGQDRKYSLTNQKRLNLTPNATRRGDLKLRSQINLFARTRNSVRSTTLAIIFLAGIQPGTGLVSC